MKIISKPAKELSGTITVPASKSHTIRAIAIALLANGKSTITNPLLSGDGLSASRAAVSLGAHFSSTHNTWTFEGSGKNIIPKDTAINVENSGTTLRIMSSIAALSNQTITFDGDESLRTRPMQSLLDALQTLGATVESLNGCAPLSISGPIHVGEIKVSGKTSQFLSSLLLVAPLLDGTTTIHVDNLNEKPYVDMTLSWLDGQGISYTNQDYETFIVSGNQTYKPFNKTIPGDWSSVAFPLCAALLTHSTITISGVSFDDVQGDKAILDFAMQLGAAIEKKENEFVVSAESLHGATFDLNATPDLLPIMAVLGCAASGSTTLANVSQARIKETDRIAVMCNELTKMGARIEEKDDGLIIHQSTLQGAEVDGHSDHRVIMALACAGLIASGETTILNAGHTDVTFPDFITKMNALGAQLSTQ